MLGTLLEILEDTGIVGNNEEENFCRSVGSEHFMEKHLQNTEGDLYVFNS